MINVVERGKHARMHSRNRNTISVAGYSPAPMAKPPMSISESDTITTGTFEVVESFSPMDASTKIPP